MVAIEKVVKKLIERTEQDRILWQSTVTANTFIAVVGKWSLTVSLPRSATGNSRARLRISDWEGQPIEEFSAPTAVNSSLAQLLYELHQTAKRSALGSDTQLEDLMAELDRV
jgi:hypothetical protein